MRTQKWERIVIAVLAVCCAALLAVILTRNDSQVVDTRDIHAAPESGNAAPPAAPAEDTPSVPVPAENAAPAPAPAQNSAGAAANSAPASAGTVPTPQAAPQDAVELISAEDAKAKALAHAGLAEGDVTFTEVKLEWEDGRQVYDVEFYSPSAAYDSAVRTEYDYEIAAATGEIVKFDYDAESYDAPVMEPVTITQDAARDIALAKVPGAAAENVTKLKLDHDDGRQIYEIEILYGGMEYEMEINAADGTVLEFEAESIFD